MQEGDRNVEKKYPVNSLIETTQIGTVGKLLEHQKSVSLSAIAQRAHRARCAMAEREVWTNPLAEARANAPRQGIDASRRNAFVKPAEERSPDSQERY